MKRVASRDAFTTKRHGKIADCAETRGSAGGWARNATRAARAYYRGAFAFPRNQEGWQTAAILVSLYPTGSVKNAREWIAIRRGYLMDHVDSCRRFSCVWSGLSSRIREIGRRANFASFPEPFAANDSSRISR